VGLGEVAVPKVPLRKTNAGHCDPEGGGPAACSLRCLAAPILGGVATGVVTCGRCGAVSPQSARFCASCAAPLGVLGPASEVRKTGYRRVR
jgi:hypothetical protein